MKTNKGISPWITSVLLIAFFIVIVWLIIWITKPFDLMTEISIVPTNKIILGDNITILYKITSNYNDIRIRDIDLLIDDTKNTPVRIDKQENIIVEKFLHKNEVLLDNIRIDTSELKKGIYNVDFIINYKDRESKDKTSELNLKLGVY